MNISSFLLDTKNNLKHKFRHNHLFEKEVNRVADLHCLSIEELRTYENNRIVRLLTKSSRLSPYYKCNMLNKNINNIDPLSFLLSYPLLSKEQVINNSSLLFTTSSKFLIKGHTSGTTGSPLIVYRSLYSILTENAYLWYYRNSRGLNLKDPVVCIRGNLDKNELSFFNKAENVLYISSYNLNQHNWHYYYKIISSFNPKALLGYPSSLDILANLFFSNGVKVSIPLAFTSSETLYNFQIKNIQTAFDTVVWDWYGNAERTIAIEQCPLRSYHMVPGYGVAEFFADHVVTTGFINEAFPLIRYVVNDIITPAEQQCACGHPGLTLSQIDGRADDILVLADGTHVGRMDTVFKGVGNIKSAQIVQVSFKHIDLNVVAKSDFTPADRNLLITNFENRIGKDTPYKLNFIAENDIILSRSGKFKLVVSRL